MKKKRTYERTDERTTIDRMNELIIMRKSKRSPTPDHHRQPIRASSNCNSAIACERFWAPGHRLVSFDQHKIYEQRFLLPNDRAATNRRTKTANHHHRQLSTKYFRPKTDEPAVSDDTCSGLFYSVSKHCNHRNPLSSMTSSSP